ncbi:MAG: hypothetical protein Homavirus43_3 [Homavirus sp.]|uniref:Uncharacterized protein n=1 Tax=Homavirus sp. TaxID=2487769 RepID=A0A3G5A8B6_9VIRU|nr:MAG: hypothetical protein Homavirus43_3 [Homavirus sp.]
MFNTFRLLSNTSIKHSLKQLQQLSQQRGIADGVAACHRLMQNKSAVNHIPDMSKKSSLLFLTAGVISAGYMGTTIYYDKE